MKASELVREECVGYWHYAIDTQLHEEEVKDIPIGCEFRVVYS